jgi:hypothetical protein
MLFLRAFSGVAGSDRLAGGEQEQSKTHAHVVRHVLAVEHLIVCGLNASNASIRPS